MADVFVWSGATGANDGSKWEDAYTTLMKDWGAEAGFTPGTDFVYVRSTHSENNSADVTLTGSTAEGTEDPVRILSVAGADTGTDPGALTTGAKVETSATYDITISEKLYVYGVTFQSDTLLYVAVASADHDITLESCKLQLDTTAQPLRFGVNSTILSARVKLINTNINFLNSNNSIQAYMCVFEMIGGTIENDSSTFITLASPNRIIDWTFRNVDLSVFDGTLINSVGSSGQFAHINFERCKFNASVTFTDVAIDIPGSVFQFHHCQSGTDADPAYQMKRYTYQGTVETDTARYRTGGASDGERTNPYSWSFDTSVGSNVIELYEPLESPPIAGWTDGDASTSHTYRIYVASGATLQNDECWVELIGPNDAATDSLGVRKTTRPDPLATPANLTTDASSTWNGADVGTKQYIDITYTPDKPGPITARVYVAKPSERVSVDPKIYIDPS